MKAIPMLPSLTGIPGVLHCAKAGLPHMTAELTHAPNVPPPVTRQERAVGEVKLAESKVTQ